MKEREAEKEGGRERKGKGRRKEEKRQTEEGRKEGKKAGRQEASKGRKEEGKERGRKEERKKGVMLCSRLLEEFKKIQLIFFMSEPEEKIEYLT